MAHVHLFCDESGKIPKSDYVSFCGFLGNGDQWEALRTEWSSLRVKRAVPPIHVSVMKRPEKDEQWSIMKRRWGTEYDERCELLLDEFALLIKQAELICVGATVDCRPFKCGNLPRLKARIYDDPHYLAFQWTVLRALERIEWGDSDALLGLLLDDDYEKAMHCYGLLRSLKTQNPECKKRISGICFCSDDKYPGVQAADMIAYESRNLMLHNEPEPSQRFRLLTQNLAHQPHIFNEKGLLLLEREIENEQQ